MKGGRVVLQQVLEHIHNMFIKSPNPGTYTIVDGAISLPFLQEGQRLWIVGSAFNDGVYIYHSDGLLNDDGDAEAGLQDETFAGTICALAVPPAVIALSEEIRQWVEKYGDSINSPFVSESVIGVYSYEKLSGSKVGGGSPIISWQDVFEKRLNRWRKLSL